MHELASIGVQHKANSDPKVVVQGMFSFSWFPSFIAQCSRDLIILSQQALLLFCGNLWILMHWSFNSDSYAYQVSCNIPFIILCKLVIPGIIPVSDISRYVEFSLCMEEVMHLYMQLSKH